MAVGEAWASGGTVKIRILAVNPAAPPFFRFVAVLFRSRWKAAIASAAMGCGARPSRKSEHVAGWSSPVAREAHNLEVTGSNPVPAISRPPGHPWPRRAVFCAASYRAAVLRNGASSEEPAVTRVAAAGSVVSCEGALSRADACCVAKCVASAAHYASHGGGPPGGVFALVAAVDSPPLTTCAKWRSRDVR